MYKIFKVQDGPVIVLIQCMSLFEELAKNVLDKSCIYFPQLLHSFVYVTTQTCFFMERSIYCYAIQLRIENKVKNN